MSKLRIETTQNVFIEFSLAGLGERILAFILDFLFIILYVWAVLYIFLENRILQKVFNDELSYVLIFVFIILPVSLYSIVQEVFFNGQTLGKKIMRIKVVTIQGKQPSLTQYLTRWLFRIIDIWGTSGIVGVAVAAGNPNHQRLGDLAANTCLIKLKSKTELQKQLIIPEFHQLYTPKYTQVVLLSDTDINLIKEAVQTHQKHPNETLLDAFAIKTKEILKINTNDKSEKFLNRIVKDYTYLTSKDE
ncbi:MAG: RDD family protein [Thermonemataceae bacterium]|nr:RDD family protein [Thermonemataceae bacterium]